MRPYRDSIASHLPDEIRCYGNPPYSALKLLPNNNESVKDAAQALIRAGYTDSTYFLPIAQTSVQMLQMISRGKWDDTMQRVHDAYIGRGMKVCGLLDCKLKQLYCAHVYYDKSGAERLLVVCYEWQESMVNAYFADIADRVEIHVQVVPQKSIWDWYQGGEIELQYSPYRLSAEGSDNLSRA